jgi:hypothetical protein
MSSKGIQVFNLLDGSFIAESSGGARGSKLIFMFLKIFKKVVCDFLPARYLTLVGSCLFMFPPDSFIVRILAGTASAQLNKL